MCVNSKELGKAVKQMVLPFRCEEEWARKHVLLVPVQYVSVAHRSLAVRFTRSVVK